MTKFKRIDLIQFYRLPFGCAQGKLSTKQAANFSDFVCFPDGGRVSSFGLEILSETLRSSAKQGLSFSIFICFPDEGRFSGLVS
jgi:hypothetical protein